MGHEVDVISGPPYPDLFNKVNLVKLPGLDLFQTFSFKKRVKIFVNKKKKKLILSGSDYYSCVVLPYCLLKTVLLKLELLCGGDGIDAYSETGYGVRARTNTGKALRVEGKMEITDATLVTKSEVPPF